MSNYDGPLQLISIEEDHSFLFQKSTISKVLLQDKIKDRRIVVVSVAGAFRKGKSFLLGFFLRYLRATVSIQCFSRFLEIKISISVPS